MTKLEAYKQVFPNEKILIEDVDWEEEVDEEFVSELEIIKQMVEKMGETE